MGSDRRKLFAENGSSRKIPWRRKWQPTAVFLPGKFHGQKNLVGYRPWGHKESDMTEHACAAIGLSSTTETTWRIK